MQEFSDKIIYKTNQHFVVLVIRFLKGFFLFCLPISIAIFLIADYNLWVFFLTLIITGLIVFGLNYFFWNKGYFIITNEKIALKARNGLFSKYHISIYFRNIKDIAYSKNHLFHYLFNYGTFFARSGGGVQGDFLATDLPDIETIYKYVSFVLGLSEKERKDIAFMDIQDLNQSITGNSKKLDKEEILAQETKNLLSVKGVKEVVVLNKEDLDFIFANEEDRNHGVYETIKRDIVLCITHDSSFRDPDDVIVLKLGNKVIFPAISFHEVKQKNVVSSSPGIKVHQYLSSKFKNLDEYDATILIGFDL